MSKFGYVTEVQPGLGAQIFSGPNLPATAICAFHISIEVLPLEIIESLMLRDYRRKGQRWKD
jgi:hypothetical protein